MRGSGQILTVLALILTSTTVTNAAELIVLESEPPSAMQRGAILDGRQELVVPAGSRAVLMDEAGRVVTVVGPYRGRPGGAEHADGPNVLHRLALAIGAIGTTRETAWGGGRGLGEVSRPPNPWAVDVTTNGAKCIHEGQDIALWRPVPRRATDITIVRLNGAGKARVAWPSGAALVEWPGAIAPTDGATFLLQLQDPRTDRKIRLRVLPPFVSDGVALTALIDLGCMPQARLMLATLSHRRILSGAGAGALFH